MEVHILDFNQDIYGDASRPSSSVHPPDGQFDSVDELIKTILANIEHVRTTLPLDFSRCRTTG